LVPVDFSIESTKALKTAAGMARASDAHLELVHVVEPLHIIYDWGYGPVRRQKPNQVLIKKARTQLLALGRRHLGRDNSWKAHIRSGSAYEEIVKAARELKVDLVLMPTRGLTDSSAVPLGSTAERVVRHAPCAVLTLRKPLLLKKRKMREKQSSKV
jgi:nucleotide-binding universal stress UspA family protein